MPRIALSLVLLVTVIASVAATGAHPARSERDERRARRVAELGPLRGMTISCHGSGQSWGSDAMVSSMERLAAMGVNWISIHPYAGIGADGAVGGGRVQRMYGDAEWLKRPIREAHRLGLRIMIKPHIAYWGSSFSWRGDIRFEDEESWARFFATYETWINRVAELCHDADAFVVGTELDATVQHEAAWRRIVAGVRERTEAPLLYAANWDRYERVPFWDALDLIGIQAYFPLVGHDRVPEARELEAGWARVMARIDRFAKAQEREVVFAELGYNRSAEAARQPWESRGGGDDAELVQRRCMTAALRAVDGNRRVRGAFLWKWFPGERDRGNFLMSTPAMREVIAAAWGPLPVESDADGPSADGG